ncbi:hypothetical protein BDW68DRAFT_170965 [Aspergillus falconensis]
MFRSPRPIRSSINWHNALVAILKIFIFICQFPLPAVDPRYHHHSSHRVARPTLALPRRTTNILDDLLLVRSCTRRSPGRWTAYLSCQCHC